MEDEDFPEMTYRDHQLRALEMLKDLASTIRTMEDVRETLTALIEFIQLGIREGGDDDNI